MRLKLTDTIIDPMNLNTKKIELIHLKLITYQYRYSSDEPKYKKVDLVYLKLKLTDTIIDQMNLNTKKYN